MIGNTHYITEPQNSHEQRTRWSVDPTTIGQCTGLRDKYGKLIFEGDILGGTVELISLRGKPSGRFVEERYVVEWVNETSKFATRRIYPKRNGVAEKATHSIEITAKHFSVIGNVTDNPELLTA